MQYTGNNGQTIEYINNAKATINPNMYCYKLIDGHMRLKGICLGKGWEDWPFNTTQLSCYQKEGEKDMAIIDWSKKWPQAKGMLENGLSLTEIAKALDVDRKMLKSKYDREKRKIAQTPTPEPVQVGSQEPIQGSQEPAEPSITPEETKEVTLPPKNDGFGPGDDEPIPYAPVDLRDLIAELREDLDLERKKVAALEKKMELLASALPAGSWTRQENRLAKLLVAVFRELGDAGTA